jgi:hypothetical protein
MRPNEGDIERPPAGGQHGKQQISFPAPGHLPAAALTNPDDSHYTRRSAILELAPAERVRKQKTNYLAAKDPERTREEGLTVGVFPGIMFVEYVPYGMYSH